MFDIAILSQAWSRGALSRVTSPYVMMRPWHVVCCPAARVIFAAACVPSPLQFVDGAHAFGPALMDILLVRMVAPSNGGGLVLFDDVNLALDGTADAWLSAVRSRVVRETGRIMCPADGMSRFDPHVSDDAPAAPPAAQPQPDGVGVGEWIM